MIHIVSRSSRFSLPCAVFVLAVSHLAAGNVPSHSPQKISQLRAKAEQGFVQQEVQLANACFMGDGVLQDFAEAARWYERAAEAGHAGAQNQIGYFYHAGIGVPVNLERSAHWFQRASASGSVVGTVNLGVAYLEGIGVPKNAEMAVQLLTEAFRKGSGTAASFLGDIYYFGEGVQADRATAENWYQAGVKLHDSFAAYKLGVLYSVTDGHVQDFRKAAGLLRMSANDGYVPAMHSLGLLLVEHPELAKSSHEAQALLEEAAAAGSWRSSMLLAIMARDGKGMAVDRKLAYYYFQAGAHQGGEEASRKVANELRKLESDLTPQVQAELIAAANGWAAQHRLALLHIYKKKRHSENFPAVAIALAPEGSFVGKLVPIPPGQDFKTPSDATP